MKTWILGAGMALASTLCQAYSFDFTGRITYTDASLSGVSVGTTFSGHMVGVGDPNLTMMGNVAEYRFGSGEVSARIGAHQITASDPGLRVWDNWGGNVEDAFTLSSGGSLRVDQTTYSDGNFSFNLTSKPGNTGVIQGFSLPTEVDVAAFDGQASLNYGSLLRNGAPGGAILAFEVTSVTVSAVPEPTTALLVLPGALVAAGWVRRARKPG